MKLRFRASDPVTIGDSSNVVERLHFTIIDGEDRPLPEPGFVEHRADLPLAVMNAVNDFLDACDGELALPLRIEFTSPTHEAV